MKKRFLAGLLLAALTSTAAVAGGIYPGFPSAGYPLTGNEDWAADTNLSAGQNPQTEGVTVKQQSLFNPAPVAVSPVTPIQPDLSLSNWFTVTLTGNSSLGTPTNLTAGRTWFMQFIQDSTGGRLLSFNGTGAATGSAGGAGKNLYATGNQVSPVLGGGASTSDIWQFLYDGTRINVVTISGSLK